MSLFSDDCPSSDSENDADYVPDYSSDEEPRSCRMEGRMKIETKETLPRERATAGERATASPVNKLTESNDEYYEVEGTKAKADELFKDFLAECETELRAREAEAGLFVEQELHKNSVVSTTEVNRGGPISTATSSTEVSKTVLDSPDECVAKKESPPDEKNAMNVFDFAGETYCMSKDGSSTSVAAEARDLDKSVKEKPVAEKKGLASVLGMIDSKKPKLTTLEKSKLDWDSFKRQKGIEEDLKSHNIGRGGFLERKRFLERSDLRAYEIERDMRLSKKKKK